MRRLFSMVVLLGLLAVPAVALAHVFPSGPGSLSIKRGKGQVIVLVQGALIGRIGKGKVVLTDNDPYDEQVPTVRGRLRHKPRVVNASTTVYRGHRLRFRVTEGSYRLKMVGTGIFLSAVGRGWVILDGDEDYTNPGVYSLNGDPYQPIPYDRTEKLKLLAPTPDPLKPKPRSIHRGHRLP